MMRVTHVDSCLTELDAWPADVDLICSAMDAARERGDRQRRRELRRPHRVIARLQVHGEPATARLYTRDCTATHMSFLTEQPVALGHTGTIEFAGPDGALYASACTVGRCRECVPGWYEGIVRFAKPINSLKLTPGR